MEYYSAVHENEIFRLMDGPRKDYAERGSLDVTYSLSPAAPSSDVDTQHVDQERIKGQGWENSSTDRKWMEEGTPTRGGGSLLCCLGSLGL